MQEKMELVKMIRLFFGEDLGKIKLYYLEAFYESAGNA